MMIHTNISRFSFVVILGEHNHTSDAERIEAANEMGMLFLQSIDALAPNNPNTRAIVLGSANNDMQLPVLSQWPHNVGKPVYLKPRNDL